MHFIKQRYLRMVEKYELKDIGVESGEGTGDVASHLVNSLSPLPLRFSHSPILRFDEVLHFLLISCLGLRKCFQC